MGDAVAQMAYGAFSEWGVVPARHALPVPETAPEVVALLTSGLTASIGAPNYVLSPSYGPEGSGCRMYGCRRQARQLSCTPKC